MQTNLWSSNHPREFWQCQPGVSDDAWQEAISSAAPVLGLCNSQLDIDSILALTLGEGRFGPHHWSLSPPRRMYYLLKPILPRVVTRFLRQLQSRPQAAVASSHGPLDAPLADFLWAVLAQLLQTLPGQELSIRSFWPEGFHSALVLTHDIESNRGQQYVRKVADLEEGLGFRSSFNFVAEGYPIKSGLVDELRSRGFEIGVHGLTHDGKLFSSRAKFERCARGINACLKDLGAVGFRAPLTIRNPEWMQALDIEYDLSFFDADPFEPIPGGTMSLWPFFIGRFVELPYTLMQDYTLTSVLGQRSPRIWLEKTARLRKYHGMALVNAHPDYLRGQDNWNVYAEFLRSMRARSGYWNALPRDVARWWKKRCSAASQVDLPGVARGIARLRAGTVQIAL